MASYDDFASLVGRLKQSSIDAYMQQEGWDLWDGDHYEKNTPDVHDKVTRPGSDGSGGGDWDTDNFISDLFHIDKTDEFKAAFEDVRSTIDDIVKPWNYLPNPESIGAHTENARQTTRRLAVSASSEGGESSGAGAIGGYLTLINQNMEDMDGDAMATFKAKFLVQLGAVISGFHNITLVRGANVAAQEGMWEAARKDFATILENSRIAMDGAAQGDKVSASDVLTVVGFAVKGAALFGGGIPIAAAGVTIDILKEATTDKREPDVGASDYSDGISKLKAALKSLSEGIKAEETLIDENFLTNLDNIRRDKSAYDLTIPPIDSSDSEIRIDVQKVRDVAKTYMPPISTELDEIATISSNISLYSAVSRDDSIGMGQNGPSENLRELNWLLYELMRDLSWEITNGAKNLELVAEDFERHEQDTASALDDIAKKIDEGSGYTPWGEKVN